VTSTLLKLGISYQISWHVFQLQILRQLAETFMFAAPKCSPPVQAENSEYKMDSSNLSVVYSCKAGYGKLSGDFVHTCKWREHNSVWNGEPPTCESYIRDGVAAGKTTPKSNYTLIFNYVA